MRLPPYDAVWDVMLLILIATYPSRILVAWSYRRATLRAAAWSPWRWMCRGLLAIGLVAYVYLLFHTQMVVERGRRDLFEHHAVVIPFP
jgi:hypothetical protein